MVCTVAITGTSNRDALFTVAPSATGFTMFTFDTATYGAVANIAAQVSCTKTGTDYTPKTAKVATSIGVPTVPGIVGVGTGERIDTFSVSYGTTNATTVCSASPCSYLDQIGTAVTSVTRASAGDYTLNLSKTYTKLKCSWASSVKNSTNTRLGGGFQCSACSTLNFDTVSSAFTQTDSAGTIQCQGTY
jgi:hypothetical protein